MTRRYRSTHDLIANCRELLAPNPRVNAAEALEQLLEQVYVGRNYDWIGIYLKVDDQLVRQCFRGPESPVSVSESEISAEADGAKLAQPVKIGSRTLGVINIKCEHAAQEHAFLDQVAKLLARYLTTDQGKRLLRKARQESGEAMRGTELHKRHQPARLEITRAAAGENSTR